uniref:Uncharacterized protein n=1 Tax=Arundo donax TaxID=35708 RepID=A0A0A8YFS1_ARUDO
MLRALIFQYLCLRLVLRRIQSVRIRLQPGGVLASI